MKLIVNPHRIEIEKELVNELEVNVTKVNFEFNEVIPSNYVKKVFFKQGDVSKVILLEGNQCDIPNEVLYKKGQVRIGVIAYEIQNETLIERYNPSPAYFEVLEGSLVEADNTEPITPTDKEQIEQAIANLETNKQDKLVSGTNIKTINNQSLLGSGNINIQGGGGTATNIDNRTITNNNNNEIQTVGIIDNNTGNVDKIWIGTKEEYNSIQNKDSDTIYILTNDDTSITDIKVNNVSALNNGIANISVPTLLSQLTEDSTHRTVSDTEKQIWNNKSEFSGSYNDLSNLPTLPAEVTEQTVADWGFTKNTGTYSKPSGGIPKNDLSSDVQTSLGKADTALQSYTEQYTGTYSKPNNGIPKTDLENNVQTSLGKADTAIQQNDLTNYQLKPTTQNVTETSATITPIDNTIYQCGELADITITNPPTTGMYVIIFTSGSTPTITTFPSSIIGIEQFSAKANTRYEINVKDSYALVGSWEVSA